jgi:hypothetical protein
LILLGRILARLLTFLALVALAIAGAAVAVFSIGAGSGTFSLPGLADLIGLPALRDHVGDLLGAVEAGGGIATIIALCALGAVLLGLLLLIGTFAPRRERLVVLEQDEHGRLAARGRAIGHVAAALVQRTRGVTATKVKVRPRRRARGGKLRVKASHPRTAEPARVRTDTQSSLEPLTGAFGLSAKIEPELGKAGKRVQ